MKTILVPIDFSKPAENAARYALHLARKMQANVTLCHAIYIPVEVPSESMGGWQGYDPATLEDEAMKALEDLAAKLRNKLIEYTLPGAFKPQISYITQAGGALDVINRLAREIKPCLVVMSMTGAGSLERLLFGSVSRSMIENTAFPLVLVPEAFLFNKIKKIGFATSLVDEDCEVLYAVASFARLFDADLLAAHVSGTDENDQVHQKRLKSFLSDITGKVNYDKVYFRQVKQENVNTGLDWLSEHGLLDMLVMVHRQKGLFDSLFFSHTHAKANNLNIPLMVMQAGMHPVF